MQQAPAYGDVLAEVDNYLRCRLEAATQAGIVRERIVLDPGIGFGKTVDHNLRLLRGLDRLAATGRPVLIGVSRKSFLKKIAGTGPVEVSTIAAQVLAGMSGAHIWRTHDIASAMAAARVIAAWKQDPWEPTNT
jgi:dihydropteroate synthase